jgi:hypothetical protein
MIRDGALFAYYFQLLINYFVGKTIDGNMQREALLTLSRFVNANDIHRVCGEPQKYRESQRDHVRLANLWQYLFATCGLIQSVNLNQRHTGGVIHSAHNHRIVAWR